MKRLLPLFLSLFLLAGCSGADTPVTQQLFAMNTTMTLTLYGSRASDAALSAQQAINRLDGLWSRTKASSDVSRLNAAAGDPAPETEVAPETGALLSRARELGALTGGALDYLERHGLDAKNITIVRIPGAFEMPLVCQKLAASGKYDGIVALGAVIRGATPHFDYVCNEASKGIAQVMLQYKTPIGFGLLTCDSIEQAIERAGSKGGNKGVEAAAAMLETIRVLEQL